MEIKLSSNPDYLPVMQADPYVSSNAPSLKLDQIERGHPLFEFCFLARGEASVRGA